MNSPLILTPGTNRLLLKRKRREKRFKAYGVAAIAFAFLFLAILFYNIIGKGYTAFVATHIRLPVDFSEEIINPDKIDINDAIMQANFLKLMQEALKNHFPEATEHEQQVRLYGLLSGENEYLLKGMVEKNHNLVGQTKEVWFKASADADMYFKGRISEKVPEDSRKLKDNQIAWLKYLLSENRVKKFFNKSFFSEGDSREAESAGVLGSILGSFMTVIACMTLAWPLGVLTAFYLEEFAAKNRFTDIIEVNINNLAAVPSIIFGLLGLSIYIGLFGLPRSSSLVGGFTLALLILPVIVITTRNSIKSIPPSIKDAATALGASKMQVTLHHTFPLAIPGIMTGTILGIARTMGETAPLLMIGMVAFIADIPSGFTSSASVLPVQIFLWSDNPEMAFTEKTSAAIMVLIAFLAFINAMAVFLRRKFEVKW